LSGVDRISVSVDKPPVSVDKPPVSVDKNQVSTPLIKANCELTGVSESHFSVDSVDTLPSLSSLYPPFDEEKREEIESVRERADREEILSTLSTLPTLPLSDAAIPDEFTYEDEGCSTCGCGLTRPLAGNPVCVRCLPPKGYSAYSHLVDEMFPRKQKVEFSKGGNRG
jgi:hypothetical protein